MESTRGRSTHRTAIIACTTAFALLAMACSSSANRVEGSTTGGAVTPETPVETAPTPDRAAEDAADTVVPGVTLPDDAGTATVPPSEDVVPLSPPETAVPEETAIADPGAIDCDPAASWVDADLDGDGVAERVALLASGVGSTRLQVCRAGMPAESLVVRSDDRYLAAVDVQGDGRVELIVGAPGFRDRADQIHLQGRLVAWVGGALEPVTRGGEELLVEIGETEWVETDADGRAVRVRALHGLGCVDFDDDGLRELLLLDSRGDLDPAPGTEVTWNRDAFTLDGAVATSLRVDTGTFIVGEDDSSIGLLGAASCGADLVEFGYANPSSALCDSAEFAVSADVDGDARPDQIWEARSEHGQVVRVCTASGTVDELVVGGQGLILEAWDADGDGIDEIFAGATSVSAASYALYRVFNGRLWSVGIGVSDGFRSMEIDGERRPVRMLFGCDDIAGDSRRELVQIVIWLDGDTARWERQASAWSGLTVTRAPVERGELDAEVTIDPEGEFLQLDEAAEAAARELVPACPR